MLNEAQLNLNKTFEQQHNLVNSVIIPTVTEILDQETYPVTDGIVYEIIYKLYRHQREEYLLKK